MIAVPSPLTLEAFLTLPIIEDSPAWEFIDGEPIQKPMPGGKHSRLQARLTAAINTAALGTAISTHEALPELRCTVADRSMVPNIAVIAQDRIPVDQNGDIASSGITFAPDWLIEILSPDQNQTRVTRKILYCLRHGSQMGWLIDPDERVVLVYRPDRLPDELAGDEVLPTIDAVPLDLTAAQLFEWLKVGATR